MKNLLINAGFPEESLMEQEYDFKAEDDNLDMVAALLTMGMTPNICFHKEKRKVFSLFLFNVPNNLSIEIVQMKNFI